MKNLSPKSLTLISNFTQALFIVTVLVLSKLFLVQDLPWIFIFSLTALTFVSGYLINNIVLQHFIYRRIKLIYKTIYDFKSAKNAVNKATNLDENIIGNVEEEVLEWKKNKRFEIAQEKKLEDYRRQFLGNVSHELKTPIFNIQGYLETLLDNDLSDHSVNIKFLERAIKNTDRLEAIVNDLNTIATLESDHIKLDESDFSICELTMEVLDSFQLYAEKNKVNLILKPGCSNSFVVNADKSKVKQVLVNLISNAIKYGKENGQISVGCYDMDENILIEVSDDGIGIEKEHLPKLFDRFYRVDTNRSREIGGTGLGLSIVKHIIEAHQQTINVRSTPSVGTTFGFTLQRV